MEHKIKKPKGTFYSDYVIENGKCYAIFETVDNRVHKTLVCNTKKKNSDWRTFKIKETKKLLKINLFDREKLKLESNQYIPYEGKRLPSGMPACATYYYFVNSEGKTVDKVTLKPYKGKQMNRYAMKSKTEAKAYLEVINKGV